MKTITLHGGPHDGREVPDPEGCRLIFPIMLSPPLRYYGDDTRIDFGGISEIVYQPFRYTDHATGLSHVRWEYVPSSNPEVRAAVEAVMRRQAEEREYVNPPALGELVQLLKEHGALTRKPEGRVIPLPPQGRLVYPKVTHTSTGSWLDDVTGSFDTFVPDSPARERQRQGASMVAMLNDVIAAKQRACEPITVVTDKASDWAESWRELESVALRYWGISAPVASTEPPDEPIIR